jgi:hypothetical protein
MGIACWQSSVMSWAFTLKLLHLICRMKALGCSINVLDGNMAESEQKNLRLVGDPFG